MIVKDEAKILLRCLHSVEGVVDEVIVVDTGSSDDTMAIAQQWGASVHQAEWQDDFATARNQSLQYATGEWILVLDADEVLLEGCVRELKAAMHVPDLIAINLMRQEIGARQNPYTLLSRLFRRHPDLQFQRPYHETIDDSLSALIQTDPHWQVGTLSTLAIAHDGYHPDAIAQGQKTARAERIMAQYLTTHPEDSYISSKLGGLYVTEGHLEQGVSILNQGLACEPQAAAIRYELLYHLGLAHTTAGQVLQATQLYEQAIQVPLEDVLKIAALINLGAIYQDRGDLERAMTLYQQVLDLQPDFAIAHYNLGRVYKAQKQFIEAIREYETAIALHPDYPEAHQNLGVVYLQLGQIPESLNAFQKAIALYESRNSEEANRLRQTLAELGWQV